jgi:hypothetical protein
MKTLDIIMNSTLDALALEAMALAMVEDDLRHGFSDIIRS